MLKRYLITCYGILVRAGKWNIENVEGDEKPVVPSEYQIPVAEYITNNS